IHRFAAVLRCFAVFVKPLFSYVTCAKKGRSFFVQKRNLYLMYAIALLQGMVFYGPVATLYRQAQGVSIFEITLIESISYALCIALEVPWGMLADRIGYKRTMLLC